MRQGEGFRVCGVGFRVQSSGFGVKGSGCRVQGLGFRVSSLWFRVDLRRRRHLRHGLKRRDAPRDALALAVHRDHPHLVGGVHTSAL